jgi:hypothetical protein
VLLPASEAAGGGIRNGREAIGDSVMVGARQELQRRGIKVSARISRQFDDAVDLVRSRERAGRLRRKVIIHLGTNGIAVDAADCNAISRIAGNQRTVYLVTITGPSPGLRSAQNQRLAACARRRANTVLLDWYGFSRGHSSWFYSDRIHLQPNGRHAYARFLDGRTS